MTTAITPTPPTCPFCQSERVTTTSKTTEDVYWRCHACGQIWNPSRLTTYKAHA